MKHGAPSRKICSLSGVPKRDTPASSLALSSPSTKVLSFSVGTMVVAGKGDFGRGDDRRGERRSRESTGPARKVLGRTTVGTNFFSGDLRGPKYILASVVL